MKLSTRTRYGARALMDIASDWGHRHTKRKDIAKRQDISESYLENILISLKASGLLSTVRGAHGGFTLTRPPSEITLLDVFTALEGTVAPVDCAEDTACCSRSAGCAMRGVYERLKAAQEAVLRGVTLGELVEQSRTGEAAEYSI